MTLGGWMVIGLIAWGAWWVYKNRTKRRNGGGNNTLPSVPAKLRTIEMPRTARDAISEFGDLVRLTQSLMYGPKDYTHCQAEVVVQFGNDDTSGIAHFAFTFDFPLENYYRHHGYQLGANFSFSDDYVNYWTHELQGLREWYKSSAGGDMERFKAQLIDAFVSRCPSAYVYHQSILEDCVSVIFKFRQ